MIIREIIVPQPFLFLSHCFLANLKQAGCSALPQARKQLANQSQIDVSETANQNKTSKKFDLSRYFVTVTES